MSFVTPFRALVPALGTALLVLLSSGPTAQRPRREVPRSHTSALAAWRAAHGSEWRAEVDPETGFTRFLHGQRAEPAFRPRVDADWYELARGFAAEAQGLLGLDVGHLVEEEVLLLPLSGAGTTDKVAVRFRQAKDGILVEDGGLEALFGVDGSLLAFFATGAPDLVGVETVPTVAPAAAVALALEDFRRTHAREPHPAAAPRLVVSQERAGKLRSALLTWDVELALREPGRRPLAMRYGISARGSARIVRREDRVHSCDLGGTVSSMATPGTLPDSANNPEIEQPMPYLTLETDQETVTTDSAGAFDLAGAKAPLSVTATFQGPYCEVIDASGAAHSVTAVLATGTENTLLMNPGRTESDTAEANAFRVVNLLRDWIVSINPADTTADFVAQVIVNVDASCDAVYDGFAIHFFLEGESCANTAYSTVIAHEMGHWLNDRYGSGNGADGFGEGNADVFAMYLFDTPTVGEDFTISGEDLRTGLNQRQYCGANAGSGCYGEVHDDGEVLMGALWKVRRNLGASLGDAQGDLTADLLFSAWMNGYDQRSIDGIIESQWLTLDDDDGNLANGTPHFAEIDAAFQEQGFPGFELSNVLFTGVLQVEDTPDEAGPYGVSADLIALNAPAVASATLHYRVDGGVFQVLPMIPSTGNTWVTLVPGVSSPARVDYYVQAIDSLGAADTHPRDAPDGLLTFRVGELRVFFQEGFEGGDDGWTHTLVVGQDDWQRGPPGGKSGESYAVAWSDPASAFAGVSVWGNDLGAVGWNGSYLANTENVLTSPPIDLSLARGTLLGFERWLTVEEGLFDRAEVLIDDQVVWQNPDLGHTVDTGWKDMLIDVSEVADGLAGARISFRLVTDGIIELGGWNVDEIELLTLDPVSAEGQPVPYGSGTAGTLGIPVIDSGGRPSKIGDAYWSVCVKNALPGLTAYVGYGTSTDSRPLLGSTLWIVPTRVHALTLDLFGHAELEMPVPDDPALVDAEFYFQAFVTDPNAPQGFAASAGLHVTLIP